MHWRLAAVFVFLVMLIGAPAHAQGTGLSRRFSLDLGLGSHFVDGGDVESVSVEFAATRFVALAVTVERSHIPTKLSTRSDGYSGQERRDQVHHRNLRHSGGHSAHGDRCKAVVDSTQLKRQPGIEGRVGGCDDHDRSQRSRVERSG